MPLSAEAHKSKIAVLVVCTGNICRSPVAEQLLRRDAGFADIDKYVVFSSAGTYAEIESLTNSRSIESAALQGIAIEPTPATQLTQKMIEAADLVLTATAEHRAHAIEQVPSANRKTYTLKEFARIAGYFAGDSNHLDPEIKAALSNATEYVDRLAVIAKYRGYAPKAEASEDVMDPYGRNSEVYDVVTSELLELSNKIIAALKI